MSRHNADDQLACLLLTGCRMAQSAGQPAVAEHLLCALEALAAATPRGQAALDQAYLAMLDCNGAAQPDRPEQ